ncbi:MAG TPA: hypothetical protein VIF60_14980 [Burkholderiaceae bacterium]
MQKTSKSSANTSVLRYGAAAAIVALLGAGVYWWYDQSEVPASVERQASAPAAAFGPGAWTAPEHAASLNAVEGVACTPPPGLVANERKELVVSAELRNVLDYFLLEQAGANRIAAMQTCINGKLPQPAAGEALQLAARYQAYMKAHDTLLASQNIGTPSIAQHTVDTTRIANWQEQRNRLRLTMLGEDLSKTWYSEDDENLRQALETLSRTENASATQASDGGAAQSPVAQRSLSGAEQEQVRLQQIIEQETKSYSTMAREGEQFTARYLAFSNEIAPLVQRSDLSITERNQKLEIVLEKFFINEKERRRAREMLP